MMGLTSSISCMTSLYILCIISSISCWSLASLHLPEESILKDIAVHKTRAFVVVPRLNRRQNITLFEAPWPEISNLTSYSSFKTFKPFPNFESQIPGDCDSLQSAVSLEMDSKSKVLFVLDTGSRKCPGKVILYDIWFSTFLKQKVLESTDNRNFNNIILDPMGETLYISDAGDSSIVAMKVSDLSFTHIKMRYREYTIPISTITFCRQSLYMTSYDSDMMFAVDMNSLIAHRNKMSTNSSSPVVVQASYLGTKLGYSSGLYCDDNEALLYYITKDYAIVRWNIQKPLLAEYHDVLVQSDQVFPYISKFFKDKTTNNIFALNSIYNKYHKYTVKIQNKKQFYTYSFSY